MQPNTRHPLPATALDRRRLLTATTAWLCLGTASGPAGAADPTARIVASFSLLADIVRELAPTGSDVQSLVGPDADAHVFQPRPAHGRLLSQADLIVVNGLGFEGWIDRLVKSSGTRGRVVVASEGLTPRRDGKSPDPHAWQSLAHARRYVANIAAALAARWPAAADDVMQRREAYLARLDALDRQLRGRLDAVPRAQRRVLTSHDAFGYLGEAYGIDFIAPQGWSTASEPSAAAVGRLVRQIREQQVRAVFVENISDRRLVDRIAHETGARVGGTLYSDALSAAGGPAATYLKLYEHNVTSIADALAGGR